MDRFADQPIRVFMSDGSELPDDFATLLSDALAGAGIDWEYA